MSGVQATADPFPPIRMPCPACEGHGLVDSGERETDRQVGGWWPRMVKCEMCDGEGAVPYSREGRHVV